jgi:exopolysaccharide biosynthesis polyprenyl glycosylphosphotransferase
MDITQVEKVSMAWHIFPGRFDKSITEESARAKIYPDVLAKMARQRPAHFVKRFMDVLLSLLALLLFSPLFVIIASLIKLTSVGPVFFKQERVGFLGKRFMFLKFRSMYMNNDPTIHEEFIKNLILSGNNKVVDKKGASCKHPQKITRDPRVTPVGSILRKTSIDELPQFINVLKGEMSLVGPRPPIPYECAEYDIWHRRRVLEMKPGLTGLWQVEGRSRTTFDEMVRMDIQYIRDWSIWLDIKILARTPWAVFTGKGAY